MTAEALQIILDLQKKVEAYERFHIDLLFLLKDKKINVIIPQLDHTESFIYSEVKYLIEGKYKNDKKSTCNG